MCGIKCDPSLFMVFKDGKQLGSWYCSAMALACAQDVAEMLDSAYIPRNQDEKDLFLENQKYMFAVFDQTLPTDNCSLLSGNMKRYNAQEIYKASTTSSKSTKASLDSSNLLSYITPAHLGSGTGKGPTYSFILHWQDHICLYE